MSPHSTQPSPLARTTNDPAGASPATGPALPIVVDRVGFRYRDRQALEDVSFSISPSEIVGLLGPNGSGKTTLFRILSTLHRPTGGSARVFGFDVTAEADRVRQCIGVVFQNPSLDKKLTAAENLMHHGHLYGITGSALRDRIDVLLAWARLQERARDYVETLSGGMARKVEIAKALLHHPRLLLLDEPGTGLDPGARRDVWTQLSDLRSAQGVSILFTTHLMDEADRADRLVILDRGRVVAVGSPIELKSAIGGDVVRVETAEAEALRDAIRDRFGGSPAVVEGAVRLERQRGFEFVPQLVEAFPGRIAAVSVGKPTLEDVFIHHTGRALYENGELS